MPAARKLLSLSALARALDLPPRRAAALRDAGVLVPDFVSDAGCFFDPSRVADLKRDVAVHRGNLDLLAAIRSGSPSRSPIVQ